MSSARSRLRGLEELNQPPVRFQNRLLQSLEADDLDRVALRLRPARLEIGRRFEDPETPITEICFPETAVLSVVARLGTGQSLEAGLIGFEGMSGIAVILGDDRSPNETYVQIPGMGNVLSVEDLRSLVSDSPTIRAHFMRFAHAFLVQTTQTALANGRAKIDERLARWLLMASDRLRTIELSLTHEFLSVMLGVRRPGVTDALHRLEGDHLIRARRSSITIRDRAGLETITKGSYGVSERNYERLFGPFRLVAANDPAPKKVAS